MVDETSDESFSFGLVKLKEVKIVGLLKGYTMGSVWGVVQWTEDEKFY